MADSDETIGGGEYPSFDDVAEETKHTAEEMKDRMRRTGEHLKQTGEHLKQQAEKETKSRLNVEKDRAAHCIGETAQSFRDTSRNLSERGQTPLAACVDHAASRLEDASHYLKDKSIGEITDDLEYLAQQRPCLFLGGAFAVGFMAARFFKATSRN